MDSRLQQIEQSVLQLVAENASWDKPATELTPDYDLIENGVLDSVGIFQVITSLEDEFSVTFPDEEIRFEMFANVREIARLVQTRQER